MDSATTESKLLTNLQSSTDLTNIHHHFSTYLQPFTTFQNPKTTKKSSKSTKPPDTATIRSLAKQFLPFINRTLSLLPKRLTETSTSGKIPKQFALNLFEIYTLCLDFLDLVSSQLSCKPYSVHIQRSRYIHCLETWELYKEAENEGVSVLESLKAIDGSGTGARGVKGKTSYVPKVNEKSVDQELASLVVEIVVSLMKCALLKQSKENDDYQRILLLVDEACPWFSVLDANSYEKLHRVFVSYLGRIAIYLFGELKCTTGELAYKFCSVTFTEHRKSSLKDQMYKFARRISSHIFTQKCDQNSYIIEVLKLVLDSMIYECKVGAENAIEEFLELVSYCANKCLTTSTNMCDDVIIHLNKISEDLNKVKGDVFQVLSLVGSVTRIYASGLSISQSRREKSGLRSLLDNEDMFLLLNDSLLLLKHYFNIGGSEKNLPENRKSLLLPCLDALKFLCQPLANVIKSEKKEILGEIEESESPFCINFDVIHEAFDLYCSIFLQYHSTFEKEKDTSDDNDRTILLVAVSAITLSYKTKRKIKESMSFIESIISSDWIQANGLQYLFASIYNLSLILYRYKRIDEASKVLESACKASWKCLLLVCQTFVHKSNGSDDDLSEDAISGISNEACTKSAFLLDLMNQICRIEIDRFLKDCLENWSVAKSLFQALPSPTPLIKQWAKIQCEDMKNVKQNSKTLYSLLKSSSKVSKLILGIIIEQELSAYKELNARNPKLFQTIRMEIICILLNKIYDKKDTRVQRSRILIAKGSELRSNGIEYMKECIQCLSEAITILSDISGDNYNCEANHLLVYAYCLRGLCTQEAEPNTKQPFQDFHSGINLCTRPRCCKITNDCCMISEDVLKLLYYVLDLLSIKGYMELHGDIYTTMFRLFKLRKIDIGKFLAVLWKTRRLNHALCASPIDNLFTTVFFKDDTEFSRVVYWLKCMEESKPLLVGFQQNFFLMLGESFKSSVLQSDVTDEMVKQVASDLISSVPLSSESVFLSAYIFYDLSQRLLLTGRINEALFYAKEAHRLRSKLLQERFVYSIESEDIYNDTGELIQKHYHKVKTFEIHDSVATEAWFRDGLLCDFEDCVLTPWNVLQCYLESTLQVGNLYEILGNGSEAEMLLHWGKSIACHVNLPLFSVSFSSILGKMYRKQKLWDLADKELQCARKMLNENCGFISCLRCKSLMEVTISHQLGDLYCNSSEGPCIEKLKRAMDMYRSALSKLNLDQWENSVKTLDVTIKDSDSSLVSKGATSNQNKKELPLKSESRRQTKARKEKKPVKQVVEHTMRTRSRSRPSQDNSETISLPDNIDLHSCSRVSTQKGIKSETDCSVSDLLTDITCLCDKIKCWHCILLDIRNSTSLSKFISIRWDLVYRRLFLGLLVSIGKCVGVCGNTHETRGVLLQCMSLLINRNLCPQYSSHPVSSLFDLIGDETRDVLAIERASLLYHLCSITLKTCPCNNSNRQWCWELSSIEPPMIITWLRTVFILCQEVPLLFHKVSRLLSALYILSTSVKSFSLLPGPTLSESHWAAFFHQASIGSHFDQQFIIRMTKLQGPKDYEHSNLAPVSQKDLEQFVLRFFENLPCTRIICISFLSGEASLLKELLDSPSSVQAWIMLSRLNANNKPISILLPVQSISKGDDNKYTPLERKDLDKKWRCPWVSSVIDDVAPVFRLILEDNYLSSSVYPLDDTKKSRLSWWTRRKELDDYLGDFLRDIELSWLGPWKYLLSEEWPDFRDSDSLRSKILDEFNIESETNVCESSSEEEGCVIQSITNNGCYVGGLSSVKYESLSSPLSELGEVEITSQNPVILVMDYNVQMLPWESLAILKNQEVYRMPSVYSISATLNRCCHEQESAGTSTPIFPWIDPVDSYYVLNPGGDLSRTQATFETWFKDLHFKGKTGTAPTIEELSEALKSHDLFIYFGHGSGSQYIPSHQIQKLESCSATVLMGCSSGSLSKEGSYAPQGAPLCYLLAGSPVTVANLWEVTDKDIDRFGKAMLDAWLAEREISNDAESEVIVDEFKTLSFKSKGKKNLKRERTSESCDFHGRKIGSFMGQARQACTLPFLIGAAPVCYGVPTGILKKKNS